MTQDLEANPAFELARAVLDQFDLRPNEAVKLRPVSGHNSSILLPCVSTDGREFVLKYLVPPEDGRFYPPIVKLQDYARREAAFYRFLDSVDPERITIPAPKTIMIEPSDPPHWILLEWIAGAVGPVEEQLGADEVFQLLTALRSLPPERFAGRRNLHMNHWDVVSYLDRARLMYDPVLQVIGSRRWRATQDVLSEAMRWIESRPMRFVHGDFTEQNILVREDGRPLLIDFERVGFGNEDHDFTWLWMHSTRSPAWREALVQRYLGMRYGSDRIKAEWGIRATVVYLALRRLRFGFMFHGEDDAQSDRNLALLDAALMGGSELFPMGS